MATLAYRGVTSRLHLIAQALLAGRMPGIGLARPWLTLARRLRRSWRNAAARRGRQVPGPHPLPPMGPRFPRGAAPLVSIVIPMGRNARLAPHGLAAIEANPPRAAFEVIIVDDACPEPEAQALSRVPGIRMVRNEVPLGLDRARDIGARMAVGEFVLFLDHDTRVPPGGIDALLSMMRALPDAGAVGARLIGPNGKLRQAGGILWRDGTLWDYGRGRDPAEARFAYAREVDFCAPAALMVRLADFLAAGGFGDRWAASADLSLRLRVRGLTTWYQPAAEVVQFRASTRAGPGLSSRGPSDRASFMETWRATLRATRYPEGDNLLRARDRARGRAVVLIVDHYVPEPDRDAGSRTIFAFARTLRAAGAVVKFWPLDGRATAGYTQALEAMGIEVLYGHDESPTAWLRRHGAALDHVLLSRPDVAEVALPVIRACTRARIAYYGHDLHFRRMAAQARDAGQRKAAEAMRVREMALWRRIGLVLYPSEEEAAIVRAQDPGVTARAVVPYAMGTDPPSVPGPDEREPWILFVAGFGHGPNVDAALWFVREVMPTIVARVPEARLAIVGSHPSLAIKALVGPRVSLFANVSDAALESWYRRARVAVIPLRAGAGVKRKTVEALWHGLPAVMTPTGAQGLPGVGAVAAIASDPAAFVAATVELLRDDAVWRRRGAAQRAYARDRFSEAAFRDSLLDALDLARPVAAAAQTCLEDRAMA